MIFHILDYLLSTNQAPLVAGLLNYTIRQEVDAHNTCLCRVQNPLLLWATI